MLIGVHPMQTYFRILSYARPFGRFIPVYIGYTLLAIVFGLMNFTLLKPLFDVIFEQVAPDALEKFRVQPEFTLSLDYFISLFNHLFLRVSESYGKFGTLLFVCSIIVGSVFLSNLFTYLSGVVLAQVRAQVIKGMRMDIFEKVSALHLGYFSNERKGDLLSKMTNDIQEVENTIVQSLRILFREPATIVLYFGVLFFMCGMRVVKAFNGEKFVQGKFDSETDYYSDVNVSMARKNELAGPISQFLGVSVVAGILLYGGNLVLSGTSELSASNFITYIIIFTQVLNPAKEISRAVSTIQRGIASADRIFEVVDTTNQLPSPANPKPFPGFANQIEYKNVSFAYGENKVLDQINFTLEKGKTIALVGPSGGGKSTLADLVPRFYDPSSGQILVDGIDLKDIATATWRSQLGIVTQESILFNDTVFNNIAFGIDGVTEAQVMEAAKIANAHEFISKLEQGYQTNIGDRGSKLSGGQRQRLSIARAVLKNPPVLILDEATSALDSESELLVQEAITKLMSSRTTLVIAHRLSTIQHADEILVIDKAKIVQRGTHAELMAQEGLYQKLSTIQSV